MAWGIREKDVVTFRKIQLNSHLYYRRKKESGQRVLGGKLLTAYSLSLLSSVAQPLRNRQAYPHVPQRYFYASEAV